MPTPQTWHDQKPSHPRMDQREVAARQAETMAWDAADDYLAKIHDGIVDPDEGYEVYNTLRTLAENASENLRRTKHTINIGQ